MGARQPRATGCGSSAGRRTPAPRGGGRGDVGGEVLLRPPQQHGAGQHHTQPGVDLRQIAERIAAVAAVSEVAVESSVGGPAAAAHHRGHEGAVAAAFDRPPRAVCVLRQIGLAQPFPGPFRERPHPAGAESQHGPHLLGALLLDDGVPQHGLPALGQRTEAAQDQVVLLVAERELLPVQGVGSGLLPVFDVFRELGPSRRGRPCHRRPPHHGQQIRPPRPRRAPARPHRLQRSGERLGSQVLGSVRIPAARTRISQHGGPVARVELGHRALLRTTAYRLRQFLVGKFGDGGSRVLSHGAPEVRPDDAGSGGPEGPAGGPVEGAAAGHSRYALPESVSPAGAVRRE